MIKNIPGTLPKGNDEFSGKIISKKYDGYDITQLIVRNSGMILLKSDTYDSVIINRIISETGIDIKEVKFSSDSLKEIIKKSDSILDVTIKREYDTVRFTDLQEEDILLSTEEIMASELIGVHISFFEGTPKITSAKINQQTAAIWYKSIEEFEYVMQLMDNILMSSAETFSLKDKIETQLS